MKKTITSLAALLLFVVGCTREDSQADPQPDSKPVSTYSDDQIEAELSSATITIPETSIEVSLDSSRATFDASGTQGFANLSSPYHAVKTDDGNDVFAVLTYNTGGSGEFVALALFQGSNEGNLTYKGSHPIGDRVTVSNISSGEVNGTDYSVTVDYLDRETDQPMAEPPTVAKTLDLSVANHEIVAPPQE